MSAVEYKCRNTESKKSRLLDYIKTLCGALIEAGILVVTATAGYAVLLYFFKMLWNIYIATYIGQYYLTEFSIQAERTTNILSRNILEFSLQMNVLAFLVCMGLASVCRLLHISRYLYLSYGIFGRIAICGLPLTVLVALFAMSEVGLPEWHSAYTYSLVPTLAVFTGCFNLAEKIFPEIGDVLNRIVTYLKNVKIIAD
jgi:hypothetical protein